MKCKFRRGPHRRCCLRCEDYMTNSLKNVCYEDDNCCELCSFTQNTCFKPSKMTVETARKLSEQVGFRSKYNKEIFRIVDTDKSVMRKELSSYEAFCHQAKKLGLYPVTVFQCVYVRSKPKQYKEIIKTLM